mmetsp:Transcript_99721/g.253533  ORF Transcript_99721/g.253533 Transcript_99721/m.253533 type:complete len:271 (-) Transcript_99721:324-1136(-)
MRFATPAPFRASSAYSILPICRELPRSQTLFAKAQFSTRRSCRSSAQLYTASSARRAVTASPRLPPHSTTGPPNPLNTSPMPRASVRGAAEARPPSALLAPRNSAAPSVATGVAKRGASSAPRGIASCSDGEIRRVRRVGSSRAQLPASPLPPPPPWRRGRSVRARSERPAQQPSRVAVPRTQSASLPSPARISLATVSPPALAPGASSAPPRRSPRGAAPQQPPRLRSCNGPSPSWRRAQRSWPAMRGPPLEALLSPAPNPPSPLRAPH